MLFSNSVPLPLVCEQLTGIGGVICTFFVCVCVCAMNMIMIVLYLS